MANREELIWEVRSYVYECFVETTQPPSFEETAARFGVTAEQAKALTVELHNRHALFMDSNLQRIRMANPFSGIPTGFQVAARGRRYYANCAWDSLGIPAALHCDARIEASCAESGSPITLAVEGESASGRGGLIHFLVPFRHWYDDLPHT